MSFCCWVQTLPERVNTYAAPAPTPLPRAPAISVLPSADRPAEEPSLMPAAESLAVSFCCWVHTLPERVKT